MIEVKIFEIHRFWSTILKYLNFGKNLEKKAILVKIFENLDFGEDFQNASILVKIFKNLSIMDKIIEKPNFGQLLE